MGVQPTIFNLQKPRNFGGKSIKNDGLTVGNESEEGG